MARNLRMMARCDRVGCDRAEPYEAPQHALSGPFGFGTGLPDEWKSLKRDKNPDAPEVNERGLPAARDWEFADFCPEHAAAALEQGWTEALVL